MIKLLIDGIPVEVEEGTTVFEAAKQAGISIPHLCYHPAFTPEGTCRMCLIEIEGAPKLELACSTQVREGMKVTTRNEKVDKARKGVLEFLLAEHPLDCPICDQAGECKLQDYYDEYGLFENRYAETKDRHEKKTRLGKNLIHDQERCILCRRCVRFLSQITKTQEMGVFERGAHTEVNILKNMPVENNYSGNLAELCPVGAITDTDFRFQTRSWFLEKGKSICPHCSRGCNITIEYHRGFSRFQIPKQVFRIKASENKEINEYWICDLGRYAYSYLDKERAQRIMDNMNQSSISYDTSQAYLIEKLKHLMRKKMTSQISLILNTWLTNEELYLIKKIFKDDLQVKRIYFVDPLPEEGDDFLLTAERSPNVRGAQEIGFEMKPFELEDLVNAPDLLLVFGPFFAKKFNIAEISAALQNIPAKILFTSHTTAIDNQFNLVFPTALIAEKSGSLTNIDGIVQSFNPALNPPGDSRAEWETLVELAKDLNINYKYYRRFSSPEDVLQEIKKEIPFFEK